MDSFLRIVAEDVVGRTGGDLSHTVVVFPNQRAKLYFDEHLAIAAGKPIWSPTYMSISELMCSMSPCELADPIKLLCMLYTVFVDVTGTEESLDDFYSFGEVLLNDFNDIDKALVNARNLFSNIESLHEMSADLSYLTAEQLSALRALFVQFDEDKGTTELRRRFFHLWTHLLTIYDGYRSALYSAGIAYEGMLYRAVVELLAADTDKYLTYDQYVFVGFNVLTPVEHRLFGLVQRQGKALFYWDYDTAYIHSPHHEAATFLAQNIKDFPSPLPASLFNTFNKKKTIHFVEAPTDTAQAHYLHRWTQEHLTADKRRTAIVLCDESLLSGVLQALPAEVEKVNVTMGYPISLTLIYSFLSELITAHTQGYTASQGTYRLTILRPLLRHPLLLRLSPCASVVDATLSQQNNIYPLPSDLAGDDVLAHLFTPIACPAELCHLVLYLFERLAATCYTNSDDIYTAIHNEALFTATTVVNRLLHLIEELPVLSSLSLTTFGSLFTQLLASQRIPFHSEPAQGLQVMGVIETGNLDFTHLAMVSVNEGFMPRGNSEVSILPYNLRKAFNMSTVEHKISLYAYYFYRLFQRVETATLIYSTVDAGLHKGERSRFLTQLLVDTNHDITYEQIDSQQRPLTLPLIIPRSAAIGDALWERFNADAGRLLSPSAMNTYLDCSLKFYLTYAAGLCEQDEPDEDIDNTMFGVLFHNTAETIYRYLLSQGDSVITAERLTPLINDKQRILQFVDDAFRKEYFNNSTRPIHYNGLQLINREAIAQYITTLLQHDKKDTPFEFLAAETTVTQTVTVATPQGERPLLVGGVIDRVDRLADGTIRIIDYKTGGKPGTFSTMAELITPKSSRPNYIFQIFLYATIIKTRYPSATIRPQLLYINKVNARDYSELIKRDKQGVVDRFTLDDAEAFTAQLNGLLQEVFNSDIPFTQTTISGKCKYCSFVNICRKNTQ